MSRIQISKGHNPYLFEFDSLKWQCDPLAIDTCLRLKLTLGPVHNYSLYSILLFAAQKTLRLCQTTLFSISGPDYEIIIISKDCLDLFANLLFGYMVLVRNLQLPSVVYHLKGLFLFYSAIGIQKFGNVKEPIRFTFISRNILLYLSELAPAL